MPNFTEVRITLAAFIYGIEIDLKILIKTNIVPYFSDLSFLNNKELEIILKKRFEKENPGLNIDENLDLAVEFLDFQDTYIILIANHVFFTNEINLYLKKIYQQLQDIAPIRNRVMHTRPLLGGDFANVYNFVIELKKTDPISWSTTLETKEKIEKDPLYVLTLTLPVSTDEDYSAIHNLPIPDFDETGFIGRKKDLDDIKKLILSNKVVSIIGDGGIGKTALALKVAYDIVDMQEKCPFELIIWTSAKTTMLTAKGIEDIHTTIKNYTGLLDNIAETLGSISSEEPTSKLTEILDYLGIFKTLLIIDNLETIQSEEVKLFIREAQMKCNIVITSRIGLGELEFPRKLNGLSENESVNLIREIAKIRNSDTLIKLPQQTLINIASKLYFNPLALKWFVNTVQTGISPNEVLNNKSDLLNFCLTNVYEKLSSGAIHVLDTIRAARKNLNSAEIIYLSKLQPIIVRKHLNELFTTTLVSRELVGKGSLEEITYFITDFAKDYLAKNHQLKIQIVKEISLRLKSLTESVSQLKQISEHNEFGLNAISFRTQNEKIAARFLTEALSYSKKGDFETAYKKIDEAIGIVPNYFESYRIRAFVKATNEDVLGAEDDYITALEIEPENVRLLYYYAQFLLFQIEDSDKALIYIRMVLELRPDHLYPNLLLTRYYNINFYYDEAIKIILKLKEGNLNTKDRKVLYTDLISLYQKKAVNSIRVKQDHYEAITFFRQSTDVFEFCVKEQIFDYKMIKNFGESLFQYISIVSPIYIKDVKKHIKELLTNYASQLSLTDIKSKLIAKYAEKFDDYSFDDFRTPDLSNQILGTIVKQQEEYPRPFVFIIATNGRYYANKIDFIDINSLTDWKAVKNGQLVSFTIGENYEGVCAKNIKMQES